MRFISLGISLLLLLSFNMLIAQTQGDYLRQETRLDQVYQMYGLDGKNVVLAMIERGIDYRHPDFIDDNGNTRIAWLFDMIDTTGANAPGNPYGVGTIYSRAQIDQALSSGNHLPTMDHHGHGTASTGIAAGDGSGVSGAPYRGVAHGATLIVVKLMQDPFPPGNGLAGQAGFYKQEYIPIALQFVKDKTMALGLPSVSLLNLGSTGGATDGTSEISRAMDDFVGPGRLLVCGVGDDGGGDNRAEFTVSQGNSEEFEIQKGAAGNLRFEAWYAGDDRLDVTIIQPGGTQVGPYTSPATNNDVDYQFPTGIAYYHLGSERDFSKSTNGKRQVMIDISGPVGTYKIRFTGATVTDGMLTASLNPANFSYNNQFLNHLIPGGSINDFASSLKTIVPTDYVYKTDYTDIDGVQRQWAAQGAPGDIWLGSSEGPTYDGRYGVDVAVPGELNIGAYSDSTWYSSFRHLMIQGGNGLYGIQNAVSGSAPVLTGMVALMLEVNPNLTYQQVKDILHQSARSDTFTGSIPNNTWGYGKLDALATIQATQNTLSLESQTFAQMGIKVYPNPASDLLHYEFDSNQMFETELALLDLHGKRLTSYYVADTSGSLALPLLPPGLYILKATGGDQTGFKKLVIR